MERMTAKKDGHVYVINCPPCDVPHDVNVIIQQTADRLAAYEDTGLEPEEIIRNGMMLEDSRRHSAKLELKLKAYEELGTPDRLRELAQADREGRCVVLPIKIPGWGWYCNDKFPNAISAYFDYPSQVVDCMEDYVLRETKEEAEAALRREQE